VAKTPFKKLGSVEILSAHLNGIQHAVNNMEDVLGMKTAPKAGVQLLPYTDMPDPGLRYRIYEGPDNNWLYDPEPVIKRNGQIVSPSEYELQAEYGAVVFHVQQQASDVITADYTHITNQSAKIEQVDSQHAALEARVAALEQNGGGGGGGSFLSYLVKHYPGTYRSHGISPQNNATGVAVLANSIDIFPFVAHETIICDMMGGQVSAAVSGGLTSFAVYTDNNGYPSTLIAQTGAVDCSTTGWKEAAFTTGPVTLQAGNYWIGRFCNAALSFHGLSPAGINPVPSAPPLGSDNINNSNGLGAGVGGIRYSLAFGNGAFPETFPAAGNGPQYLERNAYGSPWIRRQP
jgi:hypothetical protein